MTGAHGFESLRSLDSARRSHLRRIVSVFVAVAVLGTVAQAAAERKKGKRKGARKAAHAVRKSAESGGPFSDVPRGHWAYDAVQRAAEAGILQGWSGEFHGNKVVNRYQMAVVVARMLDRVGVLKANGKVITGQDIANLESLVIEFADELALLNVKVSALEDTVAGLRRDVDLIKSDMRGVGARAGITGVVEMRSVLTDTGSNAYRFGAAPAGATSALTRYRGQQTFPAVGTAPAVFDRRMFGTVSNLALDIDREFDPHTHFHAQLNVNAEGSNDVQNADLRAIGGAGTPEGAPAGGVGVPQAGRGSSFTLGSGDILVNEAYVTFADWFTEGVTGRLGVFALPMNTEVNGPSRTYLWTITPSVINSKWESIRPVGLDLFQHNEKDGLMFYVGFFTAGDTAGGQFRSGTLLSQNTGFSGAFAQTDGVVALPGGALVPANNVGRFPTPLGGAAMTDQARGINGQLLSGDNLGYYAMIGTHPTNRGHRGFSWHVAYFDRNGDVRPGIDQAVSATDWKAWQLGASYQWKRVAVAAQYYDGTSRNLNTADLGVSAGVVDPRLSNTTPFANAAGLDTQSQGFFALLNWQFHRKGSVTARYESVSDKTGLARLDADIWTLGLNWRTSDHGWLQVEYITPQSRSTSENGIRNTADVSDDLLQINYKYNW